MNKYPPSPDDPPYMSEHFVQVLDSTGPRHVMTVTEVERLAKAGVQINFADVASQIRPDTPKQVYCDSSEFIEPLVRRWERTDENNRRHRFGPPTFPFHVSVFTNGEKMFVFVATFTVKCDPVILEDDPRLYPSDNLITKLHLLIESHPKRYEGGEATAQAPTGMTGYRGMQLTGVHMDEQSPVPPKSVTPQQSPFVKYIDAQLKARK